MSIPDAMIAAALFLLSARLWFIFSIALFVIACPACESGDREKQCHGKQTDEFFHGHLQQ
jgi:hypothetical protein